MKLHVQLKKFILREYGFKLIKGGTVLTDSAWNMYHCVGNSL